MINALFNEITRMISNINTDNIVPVLFMVAVGIAILASLLAKLKEMAVKVLRVISVIAILAMVYGIKQGLIGQWFNQLTSYLG